MMNYRNSLQSTSANGPFIVLDHFRMTKKQVAEFHRRLPGVTEETVRQAIEQYNFFLAEGGNVRRPWLHDGQSRIVAPMCSEAVDLLQRKFPRTVASSNWCGGWPRQQQRQDRKEYGRYYEPGVRVLIAAKRSRVAVEKAPVTTSSLSMDYDDDFPDQRAYDRAFRDPDDDDYGHDGDGGFYGDGDGDGSDNEPNHDTDSENATKKMYAATPVVFKRFGDQKTIVLVISNGDRKRAEIFEINGSVVTTHKTSRAQKYTDAELKAKGWQHGNLGDERFKPILAVILTAN
ncbi:MAG TPA: hypothetical protein VLK22_00680 [Candidatus Udaeobacter sp.]|nr:hypothetical protein [Candidatus Udaeobacter sp.]